MPAKKKTAKEPSWDAIGEMIGKKIDKECKKEGKSECKSWSCCSGDNGFVGRVLFILGVLLALNHMGLFATVSIWVQILIAVGFALMRL